MARSRKPKIFTVIQLPILNSKKLKKTFKVKYNLLLNWSEVVPLSNNIKVKCNLLHGCISHQLLIDLITQLPDF
jgi:hypothetical protein